MKHIHLAFIVVFVLITSGTRLFAQSQPAPQSSRHEYSVALGGGISSLQFDLSRGNKTLGWGGLAGLGYHYFLDYNWSIGSGVEFTLLNSKASIPRVEDFYRFTDNGRADGTANLYSVEVRGRNYRESQEAYYLQIPILARYQQDFWKGHKWYAAIGPKLGIPVKGRYTVTSALETLGQELSANGNPLNMDPYTQMPENGFGAYPQTTQSGDLDLGIDIVGALEAGVKWKLADKWSLYSGLYLDYGFSEVRRGKQDNRLFDYNSLSTAFCPYDFNSVLTSVYTTGDGQIDHSYADCVRRVAFGIKIQLAYGQNPFAKKVKSVPPPPEEPPYQGLTAAQMEDILKRNTDLLVEEQRKEFEALKKLIEQNDPDLTHPVYGFDFDKDQILNLMHPELNRKIELLVKYPQANVLLEGHTDDSGSDDYNYRLGLDRATAVKTYLVRHGIAPQRLSVGSKGKTEPAIPNADESAKRYNRRVEFILRK